MSSEEKCRVGRNVNRRHQAVLNKSSISDAGSAFQHNKVTGGSNVEDDKYDTHRSSCWCCKYLSCKNCKGCVAIAQLILFVMLFVALFAFGFILAFYLTNTTFAILNLDEESLSVANPNISRRMIELKGDEITFNLKSNMLTYNPSLVSIPISSDTLSVHLIPLGQDMSSVLVDSVIYKSELRLKINNRKAAPLRMRREAEPVAIETFNASVFDYILMPAHKEALVNLARNLSLTIPPIDITKLNTISDYDGVKGHNHMPKTYGIMGQVGLRIPRRKVRFFSASWPNMPHKDLTLREKGLKVWIQSRPRQTEPEFVNVGWRDWQGAYWVTDLLRGTESVSSTKSYHGEPRELSVVKELWENKTLNIWPSEVRNYFANKKLLASRQFRPRYVQMQIGRVDDSKLSWWAASLVETLLRTCAEEARHAGQLLSRMRVVDNIEVGESCGERWLLQVSSLPDGGDAGMQAFQSVAQSVDVTFKLEGLKISDPMTNVNWLGSGVVNVGNITILGTAKGASTVRSDCLQWGMVVVMFRFDNVSPCVICSSIMNTYTYEHKIIVPCVLVQ